MERRNGDHARTNGTTTTDSLKPAIDTAIELFDNWFDPIESGVRRVREFIEELIRCELEEVLARPRYARAKDADRRPPNIVATGTAAARAR